MFLKRKAALVLGGLILGLALAAQGAPRVLPVVISTYSKDAVQRVVRLYDLTQPDRTSFREYPITFMPPPLDPREVEHVCSWSKGDTLVLKWGDWAHNGDFNVFRLGKDLSLTSLGALPIDPSIKSTFAFVEGQTLDFVGDDIWMLYSGKDGQMVLRFSPAKGGAYALAESHLAGESPPVLPLDLNRNYAGFKTFLDGLLVATDFDLKASLPLVQRAAFRIVPWDIGSGPYTQAAGSLILTADYQGSRGSKGIYDPKTDRFSPWDYPFDTYGSRVALLGQILVAGSGDAIATFDLSARPLPKPVDRLKVSRDEGGGGSGPHFAQGGLIAWVDSFGYLSRIRIKEDGSILLPFSAEDLEAAIDRGDLAAVERLSEWQVNPQSRDARGELVLSRTIAKGQHEALAILCKVEARHGKNFHSTNSDYWQNPLDIAAGFGDQEAVRILASALPSLGKAPSQGRGGSSSALSVAVRADDLEMARLLAGLGVPLGLGGSPDRWPANELSVAKSEAMRTFLLERGCASSIVIKGETRALALDDGSRLRAGPAADAALLGRVAKGETVLLLEVRAERTTIAVTREPWIKVKTEAGLVGWSFGAFYRVPAWEEM